jgi:hypothetical protein
MEKYLHAITGSGIRDREGIKLVTLLKAIIIIPVHNNSWMNQVAVVHTYSLMFRRIMASALRIYEWAI